MLASVTPKKFKLPKGITIAERVPKGYNHFYMLLVPMLRHRQIIAARYPNRLIHLVGENAPQGGEEWGLCLDWVAETVSTIRAELRK